MAFVTHLFKSIPRQVEAFLFKIRIGLIAIIAIGLGVFLGYLLSGSRETVELVISILVILILMLLVMKKPLNGLLVLILFVPLIESWIEIPMGAGIPDLSFSRFAIPFMAVFMLAQGAINKFRFMPISLVEVMIVLATVAMMSAAPLSINPIGSVQEVFTRTFSPMVMYFFARNLVKDKHDLNQLLMTMVILGFLSGAYAIYESSTGHVLFLSKGRESEHIRVEYNQGLRLLVGFLEGSPNFGRVLATTIPITFYFIFEGKGAPRKILLAVALVVQFYGLFLTFNRTSWYGLMLSLTIIQFFYPQFRKVYIVLVLLGSLTLWATWDRIEGSAVEQRANHKTDSFNGRTPRWEAGMNMWRAKPIRGWGFGHYELVSGRYRNDGFRENFEAIENGFLDIMVSTGLIGFIPFLIFLILPLISSFGLFFRARAPDWTGFVKPETITIYWCAMIIFVLCTYTNVANKMIVNMIPFAIAGAIVGTHHRPEPLIAAQEFSSSRSATTV